MYFCVSGNVFLCLRSCISVLVVMYFCVCGHVFLCLRSCISVLVVMYFCVCGIAFASFYNLLLDFETVLFFWSLCCVSFFDLRILITPLLSSNYSKSKIYP
jgi:hypothetical protein